MFILLEIIRFIGVLFFSYISIIFLIGGVKIFFADRIDYERKPRLSGGFLNALRGTVPIKRYINRSHHVCPGIAYDVKNKKVIAQGTLSNKAVESILR